MRARSRKKIAELSVRKKIDRAHHHVSRLDEKMTPTLPTDGTHSEQTNMSDRLVSYGYRRCAFYESHKVSCHWSLFGIEAEPLHLTTFKEQNVTRGHDKSTSPFYQIFPRNGDSVVAINSIPVTSHIHESMQVIFFSAYGIKECRL